MLLSKDSCFFKTGGLFSNFVAFSQCLNLTKNNMGQKCQGNCGLLVRNEMIKKTCPKVLKKSWETFGSYLSIQPNLNGNGLDWLCYLAGDSQMASMKSFIFSGYIFFSNISLQTHIPQLPSYF